MDYTVPDVQMDYGIPYLVQL